MHHNLLFRLIRFALSGLTFRIDGEDGGGPVDPAPGADQAATEPVAPAVDTGAPAAPTSMLEAISQGLNQPRDELGRFAAKQAEDAAAAASQDVAQGTQPAQPGQQTGQQQAKPGEKPAEEDPTAMPEGLQPKAQERFQKLANANKELQTQIAQRDQAIGYVQQAFQENGVKQEQFEQATAFIGAVNRGDLATAESILLGQLQQLSLLTGKTYGAAVDPLQGHQDLRQAVDDLRITEQHAIELARSRQTQQAMQQRQHAQAQQHQEAQQHQAAVQHGTLAVDALCKRLAASDMDYPAIEAQLLPVIPQLLQGMPPQQWENAVRMQYDLLKSAASKFRTQAAPGQSAALRPTGSAQVHAAPKSMYEAMWARR